MKKNPFLAMITPSMLCFSLIFQCVFLEELVSPIQPQQRCCSSRKAASKAIPELPCRFGKHRSELSFGYGTQKSSLECQHLKQVGGVCVYLHPTSHIWAGETLMNEWRLRKDRIVNLWALFFRFKERELLVLVTDNIVFTCPLEFRLEHGSKT